MSSLRKLMQDGVPVPDEQEPQQDGRIPDGATLLEEGRFVDFYELKDGTLRMVLNKQREAEYREEIYDRATERGINDAFYELFDDIRADSSWMIFRNEEIGALTDAIIFGCDYEYEGESDTLKRVGRVYFNKDYATRNEITELLDKGYFDFDYAD